VIEVNGRIGGGVSELMNLAGCDLPLFRFTMELALGMPHSLVLPLHFPRVAYRRISAPPVGARHVVDMVGEDRLQDVPGVAEVHINRRPGDEVDWRLGLGEYIFSAYGSADDYDGVDEARHNIDQAVRVTYDSDLEEGDRRQLANGSRGPDAGDRHQMTDEHESLAAVPPPSEPR
jgi:hypothetical protein